MEKKRFINSRKIIVKTTCLLAGVILLGVLICFSTDRGVRNTYCLSDNKCITVWKRTEGEVYIIPGRYESNNIPTISHIRTINKQFLTLYFSSENELSNKIIVRDEGNLESNQKRFTIENDVTGEWEFFEYSDSLKSILYEPGAIKFKDVKLSTDYIIINVEENYAMDKRGNKL